MPTKNATSIAVYADVDLNLLDGSAIWLASLVEVLGHVADVEQRVLLKAAPTRDLITGPMDAIAGVSLVRPHADNGQRLTPAAAVDELEAMDDEAPFDAVVLRGLAVCAEASRRPRFRGRLWAYLTDFPQRLDELVDDSRAALEEIGDAAGFLLCQTEELRAYLEAVLPEHVKKMYLFPPMIPGPVQRDGGGDGTAFVYSGKFAPDWGFLEMVDSFGHVREQRPDVSFTVVGDKIHNPPDSPEYKPAVEAALADTPGLEWLGALTRADAIDAVGRCDIALSARRAGLDDSLELSTKILEYGSRNLAIILNRTPMHERLLGPEYPLFIDAIDTDLTATMTRAIDDPGARSVARTLAADAADAHTFEASGRRVANLVRRQVAAGSARPQTGRRVLVAGHDLKFIDAIAGYLQRSGCTVTFDRWSAIDAHDEAESRRLLAEADTIVAEWCLGNAVWYSENKRPDQRLIVRLHRVELDTEYPGRLVEGAVDELIVVGERHAQLVCEQLGWDRSRVTVIPNGIDVDSADRSKLPGAQFNLGAVGYLPARKRMDRALDLLEGLRAHDRRYTLYLKGRMPWELGWAWRRDDERAYMTKQFDRIRESPLLSEGVVFDPFGPDVMSWLRKVGFVLSPSEDESFHVGLAEGMAARSVPVIWNWEGSEYLYPAPAIHETTASAVEWVLAAGERFESLGEESRAHVLERFDDLDVHEHWLQLVLG